MLTQMIEQASAFEKSGQLDLAQSIYNTALQLLPDAAHEARAQVLLRRGRLSLHLKNHQGALDDLQQALQLCPALADTLSGEFSKFYKEGCK